MNANSLVVFVVRSGPRRGRADCEAAFATRPEAIRFATDLHGLEPSEARDFAKAGELTLDPCRHGSVHCALKEEKMSLERARKALSGELYMPDHIAIITPMRSKKSKDLPSPLI